MVTDPSALRSTPGAPPDARPDAPLRRRRSDLDEVSPAKAPPRRRRKARRVHRVVHHLDVWSVAKLASVFVLCGYVVALISGYLLWRAADRVGTIDGIEGFMQDQATYDTYTISGSVVFNAAAGIGLVLAGLTVAFIVLGALLFNLISDLTGGIRMTVIDEDLIVTPARRRTDVDPHPPTPPTDRAG